MLPGYSPVAQAFMGTLFTWALTAAGSSLALVIKGSQVSASWKRFFSMAPIIL